MRRWPAHALPIVALVAVGAAAGSPERIQPAIGVGKVRLGMTAADVRAALGKPDVVFSRQGSFGRRASEWQYDVSAYVITFTGPAARLRVSAVATTDRRQRTPEGIGAGSLETAVQRTYGARLRCAKLHIGAATAIHSSAVVVLENRRSCTLAGRGAETVFVSSVPLSRYDGYVPPSRWPREARVYEVVVRRASFSPEY